MTTSPARASILRIPFGRVCVDTRIALDLSQSQLAQRVGVNRSYIAKIERGRANVGIDLVVAIADVLGIEPQLVARAPALVGRSTQHDRVHAWCSGHADRRMRAAGWSVAREVEVVHGRTHGWIDLLAFEPRTRTLMVIEVKTRLDDVGAIERQVAWYERSAWSVARSLGWEPRRLVSCLLVLASDEVDIAIRANRDVLARAFPMRAPQLLAGVADPDRFGAGSRGLAMIDPSGRGDVWLIRSRVDGRRSPAKYADYAAAASRSTPRPRA